MKQTKELTAEQRWDVVEAALGVARGDFEFEDVETLIQSIYSQCDEKTIRGWVHHEFNVFGDKRTAFVVAVSIMSILSVEEIYSAFKQASGEYWKLNALDEHPGDREKMLELLKKNKPVAKKYCIPGGEEDNG